MEALKSIAMVLSSPLAISILILIVAAFFYLRHQTKRAAFLIFCGTGILLVFSQPWIASLLLYPLEYPKDYASTEALENRKSFTRQPAITAQKVTCRKLQGGQTVLYNAYFTVLHFRNNSIFQ